MSIDTGGPAFPLPDKTVTYSGAYGSGGTYTTAQPGMSLRDWFAGQALAGFSQACGWQGGDFVRMAKHAYEAADELIKARQEKPHVSE